MNPFNLLINYIIANSRASFYNVPGNQEITNTALLTGMISENPILSYLIIENKAKIEGEKVIAAEPIFPAAGKDSRLPVIGGTVITGPETSEPKNTNEIPSGSQTGTDQSIEAVTIDSVQKIIHEANTALSNEIKILKAQVIKPQDLQMLDKKIEILDKEKNELTNSVSQIEKKLEEIIKANETKALVATKSVSYKKAPSKDDLNESNTL